MGLPTVTRFGDWRLLPQVRWPAAVVRRHHFGLPGSGLLPHQRQLCRQAELLTNLRALAGDAFEPDQAERVVSLPRMMLHHHGDCLVFIKNEGPRHPSPWRWLRMIR